MNVNVTNTTLQYNILGLPPYTNYTIHVQAVVLDRERRDLLGVINEEKHVRTFSSSGTPPPISIQTTDSPDPTSSEIAIQIGPPSEIDTGKVM